MNRFLFKPIAIFACLAATQGIWAQTAEYQKAKVDAGLCPAGLDIPERPVVEQPLQPGEAYVETDHADLVESGVSRFSGDVEVTRDGRQARADVVDYDHNLDAADLRGDVNYWDDRVYLHSETAHVEFEHDRGTFNTADYRLLESNGRGKSKEIYVESNKLTIGRRVDYTTCEPEKKGWDLTTDMWKINASKLTLNHESGVGSGTNVVLKVLDVPVFYTPYISFPISDDRKSGFLIPSYGSSQRYGFEFQLPYYWNIAPNMDATFTPRLLTDSGVMYMGEYRYLYQSGGGHLNLEYLPGDGKFADRDRNFINFEHRNTFLDKGELHLLFNRVSDKRYFEDFGSSLDTTSTRHIERIAEIAFHRRSWNLLTQVQDFQVVDRTLNPANRPYKRLPRVRLNYKPPLRNNRLNFNLGSEVVYFYRRDDPAINNVNGFRYDLYPSISIPVERRGAFLKPKTGLRFTQYSLDGNSSFDGSPNRLLPFFSLDSGLFLEREMTLANTPYIHTLEPRFYYLYIPKTDQSDLPVFDTGLYELSFSSIFREDRFSNRDRMGDANQATVAVTSRFINRNSGAELGHVSVGQIYYFRDREVVLPGQPLLDDTLSPVIAELVAQLPYHWSLRSGWIWDPNRKNSEKLSFRAQYQPDSNKVLNLDYRLRRAPSNIVRPNFTEIEQTDLSFRWPLGQSWSLLGRWNYAIPERKSLDMFAGVEYNSCCWALRAVARRFLSSLDGEYETAFLLQIELKGLAGVGRKTVDLLTRSIPGYQVEF